MRNALPTAILLSLLIVVCLAAGTWMTDSSLRHAYRNLVESRLSIALERVSSSAEHAAALGIDLAEQETLDALMQTELHLDPNILSMAVDDPHGQPLHRQGASEIDQTETLISRALRDDVGMVVGRARLHYDPSALTGPSSILHAAMLEFAVPLIIGAAALTFLMVLLISLLTGRLLQRQADPARWPALAQAQHAELHALLGRLERTADDGA